MRLRYCVVVATTHYLVRSGHNTTDMPWPYVHTQQKKDGYLISLHAVAAE